MDPKPPRAAEEPQETTLHGITRSDPYAWLKDPDWQEVMRDPSRLDGEIRAYLEAENAYTKAAMAPEEALQETLFAEMKGRIKENDASVPKPDGAFSYYHRFTLGGEHPLFCRLAEDGGEEVLLDADQDAKGHAFYKLAALRHSPDHRRIAYAVDLKGSEFHDILVKDLASGALLPERIGQAQGDLVWAADGESFLYCVLDRNHRPCKVLHHRLGEDPSEDRLIYEEKDPGFFLGIGQTESRRFLMISAHDHTTSEVRLIPAEDPTAEPILVAPREAGIEYQVTDQGERLLILTNAEGAVDFKIVEAPIATGNTGSHADWRDLLPHEPGRFIVGLQLFKDHLVRSERFEGLPRLVVQRLADGAEHLLAFEEEAYSLSLDPGYLFDTTTLRFTYSSMTTPLRVYDYDMESRQRSLLKEQEIPSGHDPDDYVTRRIFAEAPDGTKVPVSLLHRREAPIDGSAPLLLYGYGAYGLSMPAGFSGNRLSLVDRGFVYAIAHIRGGSEMGYGWYLDGKLAKKNNSFTDFIAAADALIHAGYSSPGRTAAHGGSAGGMLMGAVVNLRPDLFGAILAEVPFVDVLNTMCDADLPLTPPEWPEWGNPIEDLVAYDAIAAYSPYDRVEAKAYPAILATAGLTDPRVTYWEPAKWVARLRAMKTDDNLLLLKTNMDAGHAGAAGRFDKLKEVALVYAFALKVLGLLPKGDNNDP